MAATAQQRLQELDGRRTREGLERERAVAALLLAEAHESGADVAGDVPLEARLGGDGGAEGRHQLGGAAVVDGGPPPPQPWIGGRGHQELGKASQDRGVSGVGDGAADGAEGDALVLARPTKPHDRRPQELAGIGVVGGVHVGH